MSVKASTIMKITLTQTGAADNDVVGNAVASFTASVQFNNGPRHNIAVQDPFSPEEEAKLGWYFEEWLAFPFTGTVKAEKAAASVAAYGEDLFRQALKENVDIYVEYKSAVRDEGVSKLEFEVRGTTPAFHALHWEALKDPAMNRPFAVESSFLRPNDNPPPTQIRPQAAPTLNILLVTARPGGRRDVAYRTISRPLVAALQTSRIRAQIDLARPGTYEALVNHLEQTRGDRGDGYYHIIHFDVHGSLLSYEQYAQGDGHFESDRHLYRGYGQREVTEYEGVKAFLSFSGAEDGQSDLVADDEIAHLLTSHQIPIAILNACQSGMQVGDSETSLGGRLMAAGVQWALAMGYSVTVSAAELLMTTLYQRLLAGDDLAQAVRRGRLELFNQKERRAAFDQRVQLEDWLLPVAYQNYPVELPLTDFPSTAAENAHYERLAARYRAPQPAYGFVGRDVDILAIEKRLLRGGDRSAGVSPDTSNILLIQGMGGAGKTTLLKHLMEWWQTTRLVDRVIYFGYDEKAHTAAQIMDGTARAVYGDASPGSAYFTEFQPFSAATKGEKLAAKLKSERHLLVLDNLESITGAALAIQHRLDEAERGKLRDFVGKLAGGKTLVLLGSRGREAWLVGRFSKSLYELPGLDPAAATDLTERILKRYGVAHYRSDEAHRDDLRQLLKLLDGYPLALEVVLANLQRQTPGEVLAAFTEGEGGIDAETERETEDGSGLWKDKTKSILRCVEYSHSNLSPEAQALLGCLAPFTGVINADWLPQYTAQLKAQPALAGLPYEQWNEVLGEAMNWGLLTPHEVDGYLRLQPILPYFLRQRERELEREQEERGEAVEAAFRAHYDEVGGALARLIKSKKPDERQLGQALIGLEYENLMTALKFDLTGQVDFFTPYDALFRYLDAIQDNQRRCELGEMVWSNQNNYPSKHLKKEI
ncbi:MAG: CHAT domain-containing protein, partial [Chloroflexi bacterium]|nr:CHAT domain-containing protein [Chloroflexota bacterium]